ncbi:MAG: ribulose-phosphate 3-epimerase [Thermodesulfobacteriota bacterium]|nr:ribulose-phosphate 3-epimerase [Thermodesulfobacteriota bacterium]
MRIVPAILTDKRDEFLHMIDIAKGFTNYVQADFMDGNFVPSKSIALNALKGLEFSLNVEAHLMVKDSKRYLPVLKSSGIKKIIFHFEAEPDPQMLIRSIKDLEMEAGLAVNPETTISDFAYLVPHVDSLLFLSVDPGFYGSPFIPDVLNKIKTFGAQHSSVCTGIDGGISLENVKDVKASGVDYACVGSRIFMQPNPCKSYEAFVSRIEESS